MSRALAQLEWVEIGSLKPDIGKRQISVGLNDKSKFDLGAIETALPKEYREGVEVVDGPK